MARDNQDRQGGAGQPIELREGQVVIEKGRVTVQRMTPVQPKVLKPPTKAPAPGAWEQRPAPAESSAGATAKTDRQ